MYQCCHKVNCKPENKRDLTGKNQFHQEGKQTLLIHILEMGIPIDIKICVLTIG